MPQRLNGGGDFAAETVNCAALGGRQGSEPAPPTDSLMLDLRIARVFGRLRYAESSVL